MTEEILGTVSGGEDLSCEQMFVAMNQIMEGQWPSEQIGLLLVGLQAKGESVDELVGAARSLRQHMVNIPSPYERYIDTCGTGGDCSGTFNISTAAALVIAASGLPVAKHGNRSVTSKSGSAEVLASLGVNIDANISQVQRCFAELGICFCYAPLMHRSMRHVAEVRRALGIRTIFNLIGPLCNPALAPFQLLGVGVRGVVPQIAAAIQQLGIKRAAVVHGHDGLDEITIGDATDVHLVTRASVETFEWTPEQFGVPRADKRHLLVDGPQASAQQIVQILQGELGPARDIVVVNATAAIWVATASNDLDMCRAQAVEAIDSGAAQRLLSRLVELSHQV